MVVRVRVRVLCVRDVMWDVAWVCLCARARARVMCVSCACCVRVRVRVVRVCKMRTHLQQLPNQRARSARGDLIAELVAVQTTGADNGGRFQRGINLFGEQHVLCVGERTWLCG